MLASFAEIMVAGVENAITHSKLQVLMKEEERATVNLVNERSHSRPRRKFTQLPIPLSQAYHRLREDGPIYPKEPMLRYQPRRYDPDAQCEYHMGQQGHATNNCWELKNKVQDLIEANLIQLHSLESLVSIGEPLPSINMINTEKVGKITGLERSINQKQSHTTQVKSREETSLNLEEKLTALAERVQTLEWIVKFVVNEIQHMNPVTGKIPTCETEGKPLSPINEIGSKKEESRMGPPTPKTPS